MIDFLTKNYDWLFSGIGSGILFWILGNKNGYNRAKQSMKVGDNSTAVQVGRDLSGKINKE